MYRYDEFDQTLVDQRVAEFRDQVRRRLSGELTEDEFKLLRLMNGVYLQLHAYMLRIAIPYGTLSSRADAHARACGAPLRPRLRPLHHPAEHPVQLDQARGDAGHACRARRASACTPCRPPAIACATSPPTNGPAWRPTRSRTRASGPRCCASTRRCIRNSRSCRASSRSPSPPPRTTAPRSRCTTSACGSIRNGAGEVGFEVMVGGGLGRTPFIGKTIKPFLPKRDLLSYVEAILRVYNQYGRRDNIYKARIKILVHELGAEKFAAEVEKEWSADQGRRAGARSRRGRRRRRALQLSRLRDGSTTIRRRWRAPARRIAAFAAWLDNSVANHKHAGLRDRHAVAQADRRAARRRDGRADGRDRRPRRPLQLRRNPRRPRAEPRAAACRADAICRSSGGSSKRRARDAECRSCLRHHRLPGPRLLQPRQCALDPGGAGADASASATTRWRAPSAACTSTFPAASTPAAITTSATSAFSASRRTARNSTRSRSAAAPTRTPSSARCSGRRCPTARSPTSSRTWSPPMSNCASGPRNCSSIPSSASASSHSRSVSMPLVKSGRIVEDQFVRIADDAPVPDGVAVIVSARAFSRRRRGVRAARRRRSA